MTSKIKIAATAVSVILVIAATAYVFMTPYNRIAGVRIGGTLTPAPADWNSVNGQGVVWLKTGGFPPFVVNVIYSTDEGGIITATRPDGGLWAQRVRDRGGNGWLRIGEAVYEMEAFEIHDDERIAMMEQWASKSGRTLDEPLYEGSEPLRDWEVFFWKPRS